MKVLEEIKIHGKIYKIVDFQFYNWYRYAGVYVENQYERGVTYKRFSDIKRGKFKDPLELTTMGVYNGLGHYTSVQKVIDVDGNEVIIQAQSLYNKMVARATHSKHISDRNKTNYKYTKLHDRWRSFQHWMEWLVSEASNFRAGYQIDKDILSDDNIYGPDTCIYIPPYLNKYLADRNYVGKDRGHATSEKVNPNITIFGTHVEINPKDYDKYRELTIYLLAKWYVKYNLIPKHVGLVIQHKYKNDKAYNPVIYYEIEHLVKNGVKYDGKVYKKVVKFENYVKVQRPEHPKLRDIVLPSGSQNASD